MMRNKAIKRLLSLVLAFVLVTLLPAHASAASVSWTEGAREYVANVATNSSDNYYVMTAISRTHTYGSATTISPSYASTYSAASVNQFGGANYRSKILSALSASGYTLSRTVTLSTSTKVTVPAGASSGTYYIVVYIPGGNISVYITGTQTDSDGVKEVVYNDHYDSSYTPKSSGYTLDYTRG